MKSRLANLRNRATRKKLDFNLTLEWLAAFLEHNEYDPILHHIDRRSAAKGYTKDNLQVLPMDENIAKGNRERGRQLQIL